MGALTSHILSGLLRRKVVVNGAWNIRSRGKRLGSEILHFEDKWEDYIQAHPARREVLDQLLCYSRLKPFLILLILLWCT